MRTNNGWMLFLAGSIAFFSGASAFGYELPKLGPSGRWAEGVVVVKLKSGVEIHPKKGPRGSIVTGEEALDQLGERFQVSRFERLFSMTPPGGKKMKGPDLSGFCRVVFPERFSLEEVLDAYSENPLVEDVQPVGIHEVFYVPDDPNYGQQWGLKNFKIGHDVHAEGAWDVTRGDTSVVIAIVDTGVYWLHPDLGGSPPDYADGNIWTNAAELGGQPGVDDDGNGYTDDVRGWDWVDVEQAWQVWEGEDGTDPDNDPRDFNGHGTHVAGIADAITDNGVGIASLGFGCRIMALRAGWSGNSNGKEEGWVRMDFCAQAIYYATNMGARVINCSWSSSSSGGLEQAVDFAVANGVVVVDAAGNSGTSDQSDNYLSTRGDCIDVAATDQTDKKASFTNYGTWVDVCAPGFNIYSTVYLHSSDFSGYTYMSGTSMAAPFVSALAGLLFSEHPDWSSLQVMDQIESTADYIDDINPVYAGKLGRGRVNAEQALTVQATSKWKLVSTSGFESSPVVADIVPGGPLEIAVGGKDSLVYLLGPDGVPLPGWPVRVGAAVNSSPAAADLDGDGDMEVVVGDDSGFLHVLDPDGTELPGWPVDLGSKIYATPAIGDLDGDGSAEIVVGDYGKQVSALNPDGSLLPGWPVQVGSQVSSSVAMGDINGDGLYEVVVGCPNGLLYAWDRYGNAVHGFPMELGVGEVGKVIYSSAALVNADGDSLPEIVVGASDKKLHIVNGNGTYVAGWPKYFFGGPVYSSPAIADINLDLVPDIVFGTGNKLVAVGIDGATLSGWPKALPDQVFSSPCLVDVAGDSALEVIVGCDDGKVHGFDSSGRPLLGWPKSTGDRVMSSPAVADLDGDGTAEVIAGSNDGVLYSWEFEAGGYRSSTESWPMFRHDAFRRGSYRLEYSTAVTPRRELPQEVFRGGRLDNFPNPFNPLTTVTFEVPGRKSAADGASNSNRLAGVRVTLEVFDVRGKLVRVLLDGNLEPGVHSVRWDGRDMRRHGVGSGIYFCRLHAGTLNLATKMILLR